MAKYRNLSILTATALALGASVAPAQAQEANQDVTAEWVEDIAPFPETPANVVSEWIEDIAPFPENPGTIVSGWDDDNAWVEDNTDPAWDNENLNPGEPEIVLTEEWVDELYPEGTGDINWIRDNVIGETGQIKEEWVEDNLKEPGTNGSLEDPAIIAALAAAGLLGVGALAAASLPMPAPAPAPAAVPAPAAPAASAAAQSPAVAAPAAAHTHEAAAHTAAQPAAASNSAARTQLANTGVEGGTAAVLALGAMLAAVGALLIAARRRA